MSGTGLEFLDGIGYKAFPFEAGSVERCPSGRWRLIRNQVLGHVPGVRIPISNNWLEYVYYKIASALDGP
jgi:hypothetical protein